MFSYTCLHDFGSVGAVKDAVNQEEEEVLRGKAPAIWWWEILTEASESQSFT